MAIYTILDGRRELPSEAQRSWVVRRRTWLRLGVLRGTFQVPSPRSDDRCSERCMYCTILQSPTYTARSLSSLIIRQAHAPLSTRLFRTPTCGVKGTSHLESARCSEYCTPFRSVLCDRGKARFGMSRLCAMDGQATQASGILMN